MEIIFVILALIAGIAIGYLAANGKRQAVAAKAGMLERQLDEAKVENERQIEALKEEQKAQAELMEKQWQGQLALLREQFTTASEKELKARTIELSALNTEQLSKILMPLNERIAQMKEAVDRNRQIQTEATSRLDTAISLTTKQTEKLGKTTDNLVNALSHDNKYQGGFGEMQLRQLLENMGFVRGTQFEEQVTIKDDSGETVHHDLTGSRMQPDVILHFPDKRDIIIDAKTSMTAFLRYGDNSLSDAERQQALRDHVAAIKAQVRSLSRKDYWQQYNRKGIQLDFVVMFIPSEGAYNLAMSQEPALWTNAINQGVFITGPQNLYALLRLLEMSWKQVAQVENQQNIINCADEIVRRVQLFYERFQKAASSLVKTQNCFDDLAKTLSPTGQSIINSANKLVSYGAREDTRHRALPRESNLLLDSPEEEG
ncbi:MAG: DNA recombination protein RmuC [Prevotella sp.]|nr:DNA recombination protein RmuC [Prevotella sp.]